MDDREKVIRALENCTDEIKCRDCPWETCERFCLSVKVPLDLAKAALSLLKAQEPRVMTLEEVHEMSWDYCYLEEEVIKDKVLQLYSGKHRIKCITWPSIASCTLSFGDEAYGKRWRCWTSRPTDEQREKVKWNG